MKIGIDLDDCLNNLVHCWLSAYNTDCDDNLTFEDIVSWDICSYTKIGERMYDYLDEDFLKSLSPLPHAIEVTEKLAKDHELFIVTASYPKGLETKFKWIEKYYPHIPIENVIVCQRKDLVNVDILIDDAEHNIVSFPVEKEVIIMDKPWNKHVKRTKSKRVNNWLEIESTFENYKEVKI